MKNWWIKFGCFLIGYNFSIVKTLSEITAKSVKRYTSAILMVSLLWAFIGFTFTARYLHGNLIGSVFGAAVALVIIVQIERQIILSTGQNKLLYLSRGILAFAMAIIGSVIIDQLIFKEDIELEKISFVNVRVDSALPSKTKELKLQIASLDTAIMQKENERLLLISDIEKNPTIKTVASQMVPKILTNSKRDSTGQIVTAKEIRNVTAVTVTNMPNPKQSMIAPLEESISSLRRQKESKDSSLLNIRSSLEKQISSKIGFLDELKVMFKLIEASNVALVVWSVWFVLLAMIELLVLFGKINELETDYDKTIKHHMSLQMRRLDALARTVTGDHYA